MHNVSGTLIFPHDTETAVDIQSSPQLSLLTTEARSILAH